MGLTALAKIKRQVVEDGRADSNKTLEFRTCSTGGPRTGKDRGCIDRPS